MVVTSLFTIAIILISLLLIVIVLALTFTIMPLVARDSLTYRAIGSGSVPLDLLPVSRSFLMTAALTIVIRSAFTIVILALVTTGVFGSASCSLDGYLGSQLVSTSLRRLIVFLHLLLRRVVDIAVVVVTAKFVITPAIKKIAVSVKKAPISVDIKALLVVCSLIIFG